MNYKKHIGDGKLPNRYWVYHFDEKLTRNAENEIEEILTDKEIDGGLLGEFKTYREAMECRNNKAFYPHVTIEDRITGMVYEDMVIICPCCEKEDYESYEDIKYTKKYIEDAGKIFE